MTDVDGVIETPDDAKDYVFDSLKYPDYFLEKCLKQEKMEGYVVWDAAPPQGVNYQTHKFSFIDAIMTALAFCGTNCLDDWAVLGPAALAIVRTLPHFVEKAERVNGEITPVGTFGSVKMYALPTAARNKFWVGHGEKCAGGHIDHSL